MQIPFHIQSCIALAATKYAQLKDQCVLFISEDKNKNYIIKQTYFGTDRFPHLIAMAPKNCSYEEFLNKCIKRQLTYDDFNFSKGHNELKDVEIKAQALADLLDYKHLKMFKYGDFKDGLNHNFKSINNNYDIGIGTNKGIIGYIKNRRMHFPMTTLSDKIEKLMPNANPIIAVLSKSHFYEKYNEIFSELYQGKYAEVSHNLNPNTLNLISIPNMEEQYKLNIVRLIDSSLKNIFNPNICDKSIRDKAHALQPALKESILINADEIAKWLNEEISTRQGKTLIISSDLDEIVYTRTILNVLNESSRTVNFELAKDTNKIGFTVRNAMPSLEKKDLIQHLAEGCVAIDENFLNAQANLSAEDYDKYFADNYIHVSNAEIPFLIVREEDLKRVPIHIPSLDDIIAEKSNSQDLSQDDTQKIYSYKYEEPSLD